LRSDGCFHAARQFNPTNIVAVLADRQIWRKQQSERTKRYFLIVAVQDNKRARAGGMQRSTTKVFATTQRQRADGEQQPTMT
jgi:hypothetical protein